MLYKMSTQACLCSLDSINLDDYVVLNTSKDIPTKATAESSITRAGLLRHALLSTTTGVVLRKDMCCQESGWMDYPGDGRDEEHSLNARHIFITLKEKIQENRQRLSPPVKELDLVGYKYLSVNENGQFSCYYFLRIQSGENFHLYVKAGLTREQFSRVQLLRLSSKEDVVIDAEVDLEIHTSSEFFLIEGSSCCENCDWMDPGDGDDAIKAQFVFKRLRTKIEEEQQRLYPPVGDPALTGYKAAVLTEPNNQNNFFLRILARENFFLYVRVPVKGVDVDTEHFVLSPNETDIYRGILKCTCGHN